VWPWVRDSLAYKDKICVCVSRVVDYSSLGMLLYIEL